MIRFSWHLHARWRRLRCRHAWSTFQMRSSQGTLALSIERCSRCGANKR